MAAGATALLIGLSVAPFGVPTVFAHTDFESSSPADGEVVPDPVGTVTVAFTSEATPVGDGFIALDSGLEQRKPNAVATDDGRSFILTFDPPLADGEVGIRWQVQAGDAHPIDGAFSFTVSVAPPATPSTTSLAPPTTTATAAPEIGTGATSAPEQSTAAEPEPEPPPPPTAQDPADPVGATPDPPSESLAEFLSADSKPSGDRLAATGRVVGLTGVVLAIGVLAFLALTFTGSRSEIGYLVTVIRVLGAMAAVGAVVEYVGVITMIDGSLTMGWTTSPGLAPAIRLLGGLAILGSDKFSADLHQPTQQPHSLSAAVLEISPADRAISQHRYRWHRRASRAAVVGAMLLVGSFWFDGHTVSKGPRLLHAGVNSVHVLAGSVWAGGVMGMAVVVWRRWRRGRPTNAVELVVRFSSVATVALAAVATAGIAMAFFVLDSISAVTDTEWGRTLAAKTAGVAVAALIGAYNHVRLRPRLLATPDDDRLTAELRASLAVEATVLLCVVAATASLVAAAT